MNPSYIIGETAIDADLLQQYLEQYDPVLQKGRRVLVHARHPLPQIIALHLCRKKENALFLCPSHFTDSEVEEIIQRHQIDFLIQEDEENVAEVLKYSTARLSDAHSGLYVFTTGTTGVPKLAHHSWKSITAASDFVDKKLANKTWLMTYAPTGYAGLQVFFSAMKRRGTLVYLLEPSFERYCKSIDRYKVDIISATPTFWRLLINAWPSDLRPPDLDQATVGGEIVTQDVLDLIDRFFHPRKLTHIYASTEVGSAIVVSDRKAGFPKYCLQGDRRVRLRIDNSVLQVNSPSRMKAYVGQADIEDSEGWISTGDVVEERKDRYYFTGRNDGRINVGGSKVLPEEVEAVLLALPNVRDCVVYEKKNPVVGALLASDIVISEPNTGSVAEIKKVLLKSLPGYKVPQYMRFVDKIEISANGKKIRR